MINEAVYQPEIHYMENCVMENNDIYPNDSNNINDEEADHSFFHKNDYHIYSEDMWAKFDAGLDCMINYD